MNQYISDKLLLLCSAVAALGLISSACGGDSPASEAPNALATPDQVTLYPAERKFIEDAATSDFAKAIISDGVVTFTEYESAFFAMVQCFEESGVRPSEPPHLNASRHYSYDLAYPAADATRVPEVVRRCKEEYFESAQRAWGMYTPPGFQELLVDARDDVAACLQGAGQDVERPLSQETLAKLPREENPGAFTCLRLAQEKYDIVGIMP